MYIALFVDICTNKQNRSVSLTNSKKFLISPT